MAAEQVCWNNGSDLIIRMVDIVVSNGFFGLKHNAVPVFELNKLFLDVAMGQLGAGPSILTLLPSGTFITMLQPPPRSRRTKCRVHSTAIL